VRLQDRTIIEPRQRKNLSDAFVGLPAKQISHVIISATDVSYDLVASIPGNTLAAVGFILCCLAINIHNA